MRRALVEGVTPSRAVAEVEKEVVESETPRPKYDPVLAVSFVFPDVQKRIAFGI